MKYKINFCIWILCFIIIISTPGCRTALTNKKNSPASVSEQFFGYLKTQDYEKAKNLGTEKTKKIIGVVQTLSGMGGGINILRDNKKELINCEISGDEAICTYTAFTGPDEKVYLQKIKGRWLVDLKRDTPAVSKDK